MTEREELIQSINELRTRMESDARRAFLIEQRCRGLRDDNPWDSRIEKYSKEIDALDEQFDRDAAEVGRKVLRVQEIDIEQGYVGLREFVADAAYARML
jgi:hypothetical protein